MASSRLVALALVAMIPLSRLAAQDASDLAKQIINDPSAPDVDGAKASLVNDPKVEGGKALRIEVPRKGSNPWDSTVGGAIKKSVSQGDRLVILFSARLAKGENGATSAVLPYNAVQLAQAPFTNVINGSSVIGPDWKDFQVSGTANANYPAGSLKVTFQLATAKQTVDFGPIVVLDRGK